VPPPYLQGGLYEGTGLHGQSRVIRFDDPLAGGAAVLARGQPRPSQRLPKKWFGEGIAAVPARGRRNNLDRAAAEAVAAKAGTGAKRPGGGGGGGGGGGETGVLVQLVYHGGAGFTYRLPSLEPAGNFTFVTATGMGWGLAYDAAKHEVRGRSFLRTPRGRGAAAALQESRGKGD
jgi:glutamine cyclotransferase